MPWPFGPGWQAGEFHSKMFRAEAAEYRVELDFAKSMVYRHRSSMIELSIISTSLHRP